MALTLFWTRHGQIGEGRRWLEEALARGTGLSTPERAAALISAGQLAGHDGDLRSARGALEESVAIYKALGDADGLCRGLGALATVLVTTGEYDRAEELAAEALRLARALGTTPRLSSALLVTSSLSLSLGRYSEAEQLLKERLAVSHERKSRADVAITLLHLSGCVGRLGRLDEAEALLDECEEITRADGFAILLHYARGQRGVFALWRGDVEKAVDLHMEALASFWGLRYRFGVASALDDVACSLGASGNHRAAMRVAGAAAGLRDALGIAVTPQGQRDLDNHLDPSRQALGEVIADTLFAEGRMMTLDEAVGEALAR
jgi:tetratricopeptide (TPR) repeat protein